MIYLSIPKGMEFKQVIRDKVARDLFVDPHNKHPNIELQELVKEALRNNKGRAKVMKLVPFTIYKIPPNSKEHFLQYTPNHNGKYATKSPVVVVTGSSVQKFQPQLHSQHGCFWNSSLHLSQERKQEIMDKRKEQRHDRRHDGDSPKPT